MAPVVHVIDPDPDTVLILRNPCTTFAPWDPQEKPQNPVVHVSKKEKKIDARRGSAEDKPVNATNRC